MLTGPELGEAIKSAIAKKNISQKKLAEDFGVKPPSVHGWIKTGRIDKPKFFELLRYFSDVVDATHWGLPADYSAAPHPGETQAAQGTPTTEEDAKSSAASMVLDMLKQHAGKSLNSASRQRIAQAVADSLAEQHIVAEKPSNVIPADFSRNHPRKGELLIPQFDIRASLGAGQVPTDYVETVRNVIVNEAHLQALGIKYTAVENISLVTGWGDSMEGTINDKDPVMIDHGVKEFIGDGLYLLTWLDHLYIKRVAIMDAEHFKLKSDNEKYDPQVARIDDVTIHARVLLIWNTRKA